MNKDKIIAIVVALLVLAAIVYGVMGMEKGPAEVDSTATVATVNGVEITQAAFDEQLQVATNTFSAQGIDVTTAENAKALKDQVLNDLISNELVMQEITKANITASAEEIQAQYDVVVGQAGGAEGLKAELVKANITDEKFRENIARQITIQKYLTQNINTSAVAVTDAEIKTFYDANAAGQENVPTLAEVSEQIKQQLTANKQQELIAAFVQTLRAKADVQVTLQ